MSVFERFSISVSPCLLPCLTLMLNHIYQDQDRNCELENHQKFGKADYLQYIVIYEPLKTARINKIC